MDLKLRIIIAFFSAIALFYICQFIISYMNKKEHFSSRYYDDVEKYEDAPSNGGGKTNISDAPKELPNEPVDKADTKTDNYDLRILLLKKIDKLNITDSKVKASLMEKLFADESMKELKPLSNEQRTQKVNDAFQEVQAEKIAEKTIEVDKDTEALHNQIKNNFKTEKEKLEMPEIKDYFNNDVNNRINKASDKLDNVIDGLKDLKDILKGTDSTAKEQYIPDLPTPPKATFKADQQKVETPVTAPTPTPPVIEKYTERDIGKSIASSAGNPILSQAAGFAAPSQLIEGFENIRSYAMY
jgi:hypothetical protein